MALQVVKDDGKGTQCMGVYLGHPVPGRYKYGDLVLQVGGVSRIGTIKYGLESHFWISLKHSTSMAYWTSVQVKTVSPSELFPYPKILFT
jgi:hypothetical protein